MELAAQQAVLARLYTDSDFRRRFYEDPVSASTAAGLSPETATHLARLSEHEVHEFIKSLRRQRLHEVSTLLPLSAQVLGNQFTNAFKEYLISSAAEPPLHAWQDALAFAGHLLAPAAAQPSPPGLAIELLRYEAAGIRAEWTDTRFQCLCFRHPVPRVARRVRRPEAFPTKLPPVPGIAVWWRLGRNGKLHHLCV